MIECLGSKLFPSGIPILAASIAAANAGQPDMFTAVGACIATAIAFFEARESGATTKDLVGRVLVTFFLGSVLPGFLHASNLLNSLVSKITFGIIPADMEWSWHGWALSGFIVGTIGWQIYMKLKKIGTQKIKDLNEL